MLIILFGLAGSGKNYVGEVLANTFGYHYWDADEVIPNEMREAINNKNIFTQTMRDQFTTRIISRIAELKHSHQNIVISQALYKEQNRQQLYEAYPDAKFIQVKAQPEVITARLEKRNDWIDIDYAEKISQFFEEPSVLFATITNNSDKSAIIKQLQELI